MAGRSGGTRKPRAESLYRRCGAAAGGGEFHRICAGWIDQRGRISRRRRKRRRAIPQGRSRKDDPGFRGGCGVVESAGGLHREDRRGGVLFWRRDREYAGGADGKRFVGGGSVLR